MLDPKMVRNELAFVAERQRVRNLEIDQQQFSQLEEQRREAQQRSEELQAKRNASSKAIGQAKAKGEDAQPILDEVANLGDSLKKAEAELAQVQESLSALLLNMPNVVDESVPAGSDESDNIEVRKVGTPREFNFVPLDHVDIGARNGALDFETASKLTGSRFAVMRGEIARMHRALVQFMLDVHTREHDYTEINVPVIVNRDSLAGTGQLPKFEEDLFKLVTDNDYYLIPTSEVPVTNTVRDTIIDADSLPMRFTCHSMCFRSEAGSYGQIGRAHV